MANTHFSHQALKSGATQSLQSHIKFKKYFSLSLAPSIGIHKRQKWGGKWTEKLIEKVVGQVFAEPCNQLQQAVCDNQSSHT